jgi:hypothetical protein
MCPKLETRRAIERFTVLYHPFDHANSHRLGNFLPAQRTKNPWGGVRPFEAVG